MRAMDRVIKTLSAAVVMLFLALIGCHIDEDAGADPQPHAVRLQSKSIDNLYGLSRNLLSGGEPKSDAAFAQLARMGVKTIFSVDGARPDVATAEAHGLRYVHLPIGYDGVDSPQAMRLAKAFSTLPAPIYVHCHHGRHRGPTAAALGAIAVENWPISRAIQWMKRAGVSPDYAGLYQSVRAFEAPDDTVLADVSDQFPPVVEPATLTQTMARLDRRWDHLKLLRDSDFSTSADQTDLDAAHEALQMTELLHELGRLGAEDLPTGRDFYDQLKQAEQRAAELESAIRLHAQSPSKHSRASANQAFGALKQTCRSCHRAYRD